MLRTREQPPLLPGPGKRRRCQSRDPWGDRLDLAALGFELLADCSDLELVARYDPQGLNRLQPSALSRLAHARVAQQAAASLVQHPQFE